MRKEGIVSSEEERLNQSLSFVHIICLLKCLSRLKLVSFCDLIHFDVIETG